MMLKICCSFYTTAVLAIIYALAMAVATFIEGDVNYGTAAARDLIYGALWFDALHALLALNLIGVFLYKKLYKTKKYHVLLLHASLIVILLGAGLTRYFGFEGVMHIREGYSSNIILSNDEHINIRAGADNKIYSASFPVSYTAVNETKFDEKIPLFDNEVSFKFISYEPAQNAIDFPVLTMEVSYKSESKEIELIQSFLGFGAEFVSLGDVDFEISWGPKETMLPFSIFLEDFELERYAGSMSPSSYASRVIVRDGEDSKPFRIFMNNVLDYRGYRFFQSSYDEDEGGTILSVNNDPGKIPTYIGYAMLICGLLWGFFAKNGRFFYLIKKLKNNQAISLIFLSLFIFCAPNIYSYESYESGADFESEHGSMFFDDYQEPSEEDILRVLSDMKNNLSAHSKKLGELLVQDFGGRVKPLDTQAMELVHKITKKDGFFGLNNVEILLGMMTYYDTFQRVKMFAINSPELREILGVDSKQKHISFLDAFDGDNYKLGNYIEDANRKDPSKRTSLDKEIIKLDERISLAYIIYTAQVLQIFPNISGDTNAWLSPADAIIAFSQSDALKVQTMLQNYFGGVDKGVRTNVWDDANNALNALKNFQNEHGKNGISKNRVKLEIWLNHYNPFKNLTYAYLLFGFMLVISAMIAIFRNKTPSAKFNLVMRVLIAILLIIHTIALLIRWYVAGHAPWSNAYESMIYIAWAGMLAGGVFFRFSHLALGTASLMAGISLFVAHLGFMDPQIGNLVPVLKSYWLNIHVSVITASYGFFGFSFLLGILTLILFALNSKKHLNQTILNLSYINELSLLLGLALLTIGNFLGGVWANESWGRYWGWDSKETWSLITIVIYALIIHMRFIPRLNSAFSLSIGSVLGFFSVLMTYFGVNFYLTGKHSYASGEAIPIPVFLYILVGALILLFIFSARNRKIE